MASVKYRDEFLEALLKEISIRKDYLGVDAIDTIYLGGGTPSMLSRDHLDHIFNALHRHFSISDGAEVTLEANPDDLSQDFLKNLVSSPVNRLSIGVQSFRNADLKYLHRVHSADQSIEAIRNAQLAGFSELTVDLIYGIPGLSNKGWQSNLKTFLSLQVPHLSAYALTLEPKTAMDVLIKKGKMQEPDDKNMADQYKILGNLMSQYAFQQYEISNFCQEGHIAKHNTNYWLGGKYLGLGPSAHSFNGSSRQWNIGHMKDYIEGYINNKPPIEKEVLTKSQVYNEYIMVSLRTMWGVDLKYLRKKFGDEYLTYFLQESKKFKASGQLENVADKVILTSKGKFFADGISSDLFWPSQNL